MRAAALALLVAMPAAAQPAGPPWAERIADLAPALRACLAGRNDAMVVTAWPMNHGLALSRLMLADGTREDCVADLGRAQVIRREPVASGERLPGEGIQAFMLDRRCADARRVEDASGAVLGWLAYPACR